MSDAAPIVPITETVAWFSEIEPGDRRAMPPPPASEQNQQEFYWMMATVGRPASVLEIGSREGGLLRLMTAFLVPGARICSIDVGVPNPEWQNGRDTVPGLRRTIMELRGKGYDARVLIGDSHDAGAVAWATANGPYDLVFIDADHSYDGVRQDWERYGSLGKMVGLHDLTIPEVAQLWTEIKAAGVSTQEMIAPDGGTGIGLVTLPASAAAAS